MQPLRFKEAALAVCSKTADEIIALYKNVDEETAPFLCLDLSFISALLEHGFGVADTAELLMAQKLIFRGEAIETQWPLGASLEELSEELAKLRAIG
jgi:Golgi nucleoside diphosphatase